MDPYCHFGCIIRYTWRSYWSKSNIVRVAAPWINFWNCHVGIPNNLQKILQVKSFMKLFWCVAPKERIIVISMRILWVRWKHSLVKLTDSCLKNNVRLHLKLLFLLLLMDFGCLNSSGSVPWYQDHRLNSEWSCASCCGSNTHGWEVEWTKKIAHLVGAHLSEIMAHFECSQKSSTLANVGQNPWHHRMFAVFAYFGSSGINMIWQK